MGRSKKDVKASILEAIDTIATLCSEDDEFLDVGNVVSSLKNSLLRKEILRQSRGKVFIIDKESGSYVEVNGVQAENAILKVVDPDLYRHYQSLMEDFLSNFSDDSLFVKMYGRKGEKVFP